MKFKKFLNSTYLKDNPLCAVETTKDSLNLATGSCTRSITKLVLDGTENWVYVSGQSADYYRLENMPATASKVVCSHYVSPTTDINYSSTATGMKMQSSSSYGVILACRPDNVSSLNAFKAFLAEQYAANTPVTVWYIKDTATTETVTVPTALSGTIYGSLTQSTTPTYSNPVYPTANNAMGWYDIGYHIRSSGAWTNETDAYKRVSGAWSNS